MAAPPACLRAPEMTALREVAVRLPAQAERTISPSRSIAHPSRTGVAPAYPYGSASSPVHSLAIHPALRQRGTRVFMGLPHSQVVGVAAACDAHGKDKAAVTTSPPVHSANTSGSRARECC